MLFRPRCVLRLKLTATFNGVGATVAVCVLRHDAYGTAAALAPLRYRRTLHLPVELAALAIVIVPMAEIIVVHNSSYVCYWPITSRIVHGVCTLKYQQPSVLRSRRSNAFVKTPQRVKPRDEYALRALIRLIIGYSEKEATVSTR